MAIVRVTIAEHAGGACVFWYEWDNQASRRWLTAFGCDNATAEPAYAKAWQLSDPTRVYEQTFPANQNTVISIPTNQAARLQLHINARGRLDGVQYETAWPAIT